MSDPTTRILQMMEVSNHLEVSDDEGTAVADFFSRGPADEGPAEFVIICEDWLHVRAKDLSWATLVPGGFNLDGRSFRFFVKEPLPDLRLETPRNDEL